MIGLLYCGSETTDENRCTQVPSETAGPFPGDGSNGPNVLASGLVIRSDLRSSFGGLTGTAPGVVLRVHLTVKSAADCFPFQALAIYLWGSDREGRYSLYSPGVTDQNFLRGVQQTGLTGAVNFTTIFPGCYPGRWPHLHFEVYPSLTGMQSGASPMATSQLALPKSTCDLVYATPGYEASVTNLQQLALATDSVFGDGATLQTPTMTGGVASGFVAQLSVSI